jgi:hypothetical protein
MSKKWIEAKRPEFVRDVLRDFCLSARELERIFRHFDQTGEVEFEALHELLGDEMIKGLLWRLKDTSHHLFRNEPEQEVMGRFVDWGIGYVFHESVKLKEDAYQQRHYAPRFREIAARDLCGAEGGFCGELFLVLGQTRESISREIARIRFILGQCKLMLSVYLAQHRDNELLARFIFEQMSLVRQVFAAEYPRLVKGIYGDEPEALFVLAGSSLRQGGWTSEAGRALKEALALNPKCARALAEQKLLAETKNAALA